MSRPGAAVTSPGRSDAVAAVASGPSAIAAPSARSDALAARVRAFFADPVASVDRLGTGHDSSETTLRLLDEIGARTRALGELNRELVPMVDRFAGQSRRQRWWNRFVGEALERDLSFGLLCERLSDAISRGGEVADGTAATIAALKADRLRIDAEIAALQDDLSLGHAVLDPARAPLRRACGAPEDTWSRLSRRVGNLEAMATALVLTQSQYAVAIDGARAVVDRFTEIRHVLIPLWRQRMGFELFARRTAPDGTVSAGPSPTLPDPRSPASAPPRPSWPSPPPFPRRSSSPRPRRRTPSPPAIRASPRWSPRSRAATSNGSTRSVARSARARRPMPTRRSNGCAARISRRSARSSARSSGPRSR